MNTTPAGEINLNETGERRQRPPEIRGVCDPMNQTNYTSIHIQISSEPKTNARKAHCKHCARPIQPGEGVGYPSEFGYGGGEYYLCQADAAVWERIKATQVEVEESLASIAAYLAIHLDSRGGLDTGSYFGYFSLRNGASLAYGRVRAIIESSGMYRCEVAQAIDLTLTEESPATLDDVTIAAERAAVQTLTAMYEKSGELPWVKDRLYKAVMEIPT
jgi:hypothetical protein